MTKKLRVLFLPQYSDKGSQGAFYRVYNYLPLLRAEGIEGVVSPGQKYRYFQNCKPLKLLAIGVLTTFRRFIDIFRIKNYDVIYFYREVYQASVYPFFEKIYSKLNKNIVFDFDDAIYLDNKYIPKILGWSKEVVAGNQNLADYAKKYNKKIIIIPTPSKEEDIKLTKNYSAKKNEKLVIGWIGNVEPHLPNLKMVKNVLKRLSNKYSFELRIIGSLGNKEIHKMYSDIPNVDIIHSVPPPEAQKALVQFDIGIMPLQDTEWNCGKCAKKLLDYFGAGLATVSSPVGMNKEIVQNGKNGYFARNEKEWYEKLEKLIKDVKLRERLGENARKTITEKYLLKPCAKKMIEVIRRAAKE